MIPLLMQKDYSPKGYVCNHYRVLADSSRTFILIVVNCRWLGLILGTRMWYGSSD